RVCRTRSLARATLPAGPGRAATPSDSIQESLDSPFLLPGLRASLQRLRKNLPRGEEASPPACRQQPPVCSMIIPPRPDDHMSISVLRTPRKMLAVQGHDLLFV